MYNHIVHVHIPVPFEFFTFFRTVVSLSSDTALFGQSCQAAVEAATSRVDSMMTEVSSQATPITDTGYVLIIRTPEMSTMGYGRRQNRSVLLVT